MTEMALPLPRGHRIESIKRIVRKNWDEIGIATALGHFVATNDSTLPPDHAYIVEAIRRSRTDLQEADTDTIRDYVSSLDEEQTPGLVNNVKGIANEIYYVELENGDGDTVKAYLFEETNHPTYDVVLYDDETGDTIPLQLKATDSEAYVQDAIDEVGSDHVRVTREMAEKMGLESTGISNEDLEADVEVVVDYLVEDSSLWNYVPGLTAWSVALVIASLARRYARGEISRRKFLSMVGVFGGAKAIKVALIVAGLSIPGVNVVVGALLFLKMAGSVKDGLGGS